MRVLALIIAVCALLAGIVGIVAPEALVAMGRHFVTPVGLYVAAALRAGVGLVLLAVAPASRAPKTLRVFGILVLISAVGTLVLGVERAHAILDWASANGAAFIRLPAAGALVFGSVVAYAVARRRS